ncbi:peptide chain release factor N(5)-glutamine methyltransferase [Mesoplasma seiffertii]|uniref:peptide chain release factor N(5)-glutamine methyltransferase n=1 Tax=Mesoplasma seiffertii TaxID=28224 RepID=UPI00047A1086|nr:peptide chain release factor N(5)-glutamine methyltransferase [Mesoplasma seiffertii]
MSHKPNLTIRDLYYKLINLNISLKTADVYQILEHLLKMEYSDIISNFEMTIEVNEKLLNELIKELEMQKPLAYILQQKYFFKRKFTVDERVLIPRPETEILIETALRWINHQQNILIADICTGSGVIGITLNLETNNSVICTDISDAALAVAQINSQNLKTQNVKFYQGDFLKPLIEQNLKVNLLVSNPPYIDYQDQDLSVNVQSFEPHLALFADNNGLAFYQTMIDNLDKVMDLSKPFAVIMEFGWKQKAEIEKLLKNSQVKITWEFVRDYSDNWRCVIITNV